MLFYLIRTSELPNNPFHLLSKWNWQLLKVTKFDIQPSKNPRFGDETQLLFVGG